MAKRMEDTSKYRKQFIRSLPGPYKLLWDYICCECDHAGIWDVDFEIAQICLGADMLVNAEKALEFFNADEERIKIVDNGKKWFIKPFVSFQYGELNPQNKVHLSVINRISNYIDEEKNKGLASPLQGAKDKDKDKDKESISIRGDARGGFIPDPQCVDFPSDAQADNVSIPEDKDFQKAMNRWFDIVQRWNFKGRERENLSDALATHGLEWVLNALESSSSSVLFKRFEEKEKRDSVSPRASPANRSDDVGRRIADAVFGKVAQ